MSTETDREDIARSTGVPATVLRGDTREELQAHADELAALGYGKPELNATEIVDRVTGKTGDADDIVTQALGR